MSVSWVSICTDTGKWKKKFRGRKYFYLHELQEVDAAVVVAVRLLHHLRDLLVPEPLAEVEHTNAEFIFGYFTVSVCIKSSENKIVFYKKIFNRTWIRLGST